MISLAFDLLEITFLSISNITQYPSLLELEALLSLFVSSGLEASSWS